MIRLNYSDLTIIIPTLNEYGTIGRLVHELSARYAGVHVIVSDDGSTDGTVNAVLGTSKANRNVRLLDRSSAQVHGLTASVVDAAKVTTTKYIVVMDADMQHPPNVVGQIYKKLADGDDIVVGVRSKVRRWTLYRLALSKGIIFVARIVFVIRRKKCVSDMMSGLFGIKTSVFKDVIRRNERKFVGDGYKVLLDLLRMVGPGTKVSEVRYATFHPRRFGASKLKVKHMLLILRSLLTP